MSDYRPHNNRSNNKSVLIPIFFVVGLIAIMLIFNNISTSDRTILIQGTPITSGYSDGGGLATVISGHSDGGGLAE